MSTALTFGKVSGGYKWRPHKQPALRPVEMKTSHLFYTLRLLWNSTAKPTQIVGNYRPRSFAPTYTRDYIAISIIALGDELLNRRDLLIWQQEQLKLMALYAMANRKRIEK